MVYIFCNERKENVDEYTCAQCNQCSGHKLKIRREIETLKLRIQDSEAQLRKLRLDLDAPWSDDAIARKWNGIWGGVVSTDDTITRLVKEIRETGCSTGRVGEMFVAFVKEHLNAGK